MLTTLMDAVSIILIAICWIMLVRFALEIITLRNHPDKSECWLRLIVFIFLLAGVTRFSLWIGDVMNAGTLDDHPTAMTSSMFGTFICFFCVYLGDMNIQVDFSPNKITGWVLTLRGRTFVKDIPCVRTRMERILGTKFLVPGIKIEHNGATSEEGWRIHATLVVKANGTTDPRRFLHLFGSALWGFDALLNKIASESLDQSWIIQCFRSFTDDLSGEVDVEVQKARLYPKPIPLF